MNAAPNRSVKKQRSRRTVLALPDGGVRRFAPHAGGLSVRPDAVHPLAQVQAPGQLASLDAIAPGRLCRLARSRRPGAQQRVPAPGEPFDILPIPGLRRPASAKTSPSCWSPRRSGTACRRCSVPPHAKRLLESPSPLTRLGRRDRAALETLYATGCRASEVVGLRPVDLDSKAGTARCVGKGNKERQVPLGSRAIAALVRLPRARPPGTGRKERPETATVFVSKSGRPLSRIGLWQIVKRHCPISRAARRRQPAHSPAQLRHPSARRRCRPARRPGDAWPRLDRHDPDLYAGRAQPAARSPRPVSSSRSGNSPLPDGPAALTVHDGGEGSAAGTG